MGLKAIFAGAAVFAIVCIAINCGDKKATEPQNTSPVGSWKQLAIIHNPSNPVYPDTATLSLDVIEPDSFYLYETYLRPSSFGPFEDTVSETGTWATSGNSITLNSLHCKRFDAITAKKVVDTPCTGPADYPLTITGTTWKLTRPGLINPNNIYYELKKQ